jgi:hypothetical protein
MTALRHITGPLKNARGFIIRLPTANHGDAFAAEMPHHFGRVNCGETLLLVLCSDSSLSNYFAQEAEEWAPQK